jgi:alcohol dehydrogenase, propanol-preferring
MKAWQFVEVGQPLTLRDVPQPTAGPDDVLIDVRAAGLCHSDVSFLDGNLSSLLPFSPITLGHEIAGMVCEVGSAVTGFAIGDRVGVPAAIEGPGTSLDGGFAAKVRVPARLVVPVPDGVPWEQAAAATDAGLTSYNAVAGTGGVGAGMIVGVIGLGGLGALGTQTAIALGASVYAAEVNEAAHEYARELGVAGVSSSLRDFPDQSFDVVLDFVGLAATTNDAIEVVRDRGRVVRVGLAQARGEVNLSAITLKALQVLGSQAGSKEDCSAVLDLVAQGRLRSRITTIGFDEIGTGVERLTTGGVVGRLVALFD